MASAGRLSNPRGVCESPRLTCDAVDMAPPDALGEFEQAVLLAVVHIGADAYGVPIRQEIERRTGAARLDPVDALRDE